MTLCRACCTTRLDYASPALPGRTPASLSSSIHRSLRHHIHSISTSLAAWALLSKQKAGNAHMLPSSRQLCHGLVHFLLLRSLLGPPKSQADVVAVLLRSRPFWLQVLPNNPPPGPVLLTDSASLGTTRALIRRARHPSPCLETNLASRPLSMNQAFSGLSKCVHMMGDDRHHCKRSLDDHGDPARLHHSC